MKDSCLTYSQYPSLHGLIKVQGTATYSTNLLSSESTVLAPIIILPARHTGYWLTNDPTVLHYKLQQMLQTITNPHLNMLELKKGKL